ncbi:MFS transporter [Allokutzneria sp. NRRL B-24872]|uniref:MFS transporter n=1 Tax=Allokutzneria sp. NRRL B-24872 TaxID=1137961 RepID=UPI000A3799A3|nr:MFS transporter [Allokutzneria sp. NRRL B-24872]
MSTSADPAPTTEKLPDRLPNEVWVLVAASFVIAIGFGIVAPALPGFAASFDVGVTASSIVISAFAFTRLAFAPASGKLVARFGERPIYVWGLLIVAVSTGACAFAGDYWQLLVLRALGGTGSTMFTVSAVALLIRLSPPHLRGRASGVWATGFLLGNIAGPIVGGGLVGISMKLPFLTYAVALMIAAFVAWFFLRNSSLASADRDDSRPLFTVREAFGHGAYRASLASNFATGWTVYGVRMALIPLFVTQALRENEAWAGISLSVFAGGNALVLLFSGKLADTKGRKPLAVAGLVLAGASMIWLGFTDSIPAFLAASVVAGFGAGLLTPAQGAAVADVVGNEKRGGPVLAGFQMAADVGTILGPLLAGVMAENLSFETAFAVTGFTMLLALVPWLMAPETLPKGPGEHTASDVAAESACIDEGPELPTGERVAGKPQQPQP